MASRKSARISAKADAVAMQNVTTIAQGSRALKKMKISNKELDDNAIADHSNPSINSKFMKEIPFDVLLEIFSFLEPIDWLHLSRVSKSLHSLLTSNDLSSLWKLAYKNIEQDYRPPLCPDDTNVVVYTNYLYGRHCQLCSSRSGKIYHESAFIRLCLTCAETSFLSLRLDASEVDPAIRHLCNKWVFPEYKKGGQMILNAEYTLRCKEFKHAQKEKRWQSYFAERDRTVLERDKLASHIAQWRKKMLYKLKAIHDSRVAGMRKRLEEEGYKADVKGWQDAHRFPHVRKSHGLSDSEWSFIRADVLDFLQGRREKRAVSAMRTKLLNRIAQLEGFISQWKIRPTLWWVASSEPIASFIKSGLKRIPKEDLKKAEPQIRNLITSWKKETDRYLVALMPQPSGKGRKKDTHSSKTSALELATTFFKCDWCTEPISYPRILMHSCLVEDQDKAGSEEENDCDMEDIEDVVANADGPRVPRSPQEVTVDTVFPTLSDCYSSGMCAGKEGVRFNEGASDAARDIIKACGQDPMAVSYAAMEEMQTRLECLRCSRATQVKQKAKSVRFVMKWLMAIVHDLEEHSGDPASCKPAWGKIDSLDLAKVNDAEINIRKLRKYKTPVSCKHCSWSGDTQEQQSDHITSQHKIIVDEDTLLSHHFGPQLDASIKAMYPVVKI